MFCNIHQYILICSSRYLKNEMAYHKILIDYSEYIRLKAYEEKYEASLKKRPGSLTGGGDLSAIVSQNEEKNELETPLLKTTPTITTPVNAQLEDNIEPVLKPTTGASQRGEDSNTNWYYLGYPKHV